MYASRAIDDALRADFHLGNRIGIVNDAWDLYYRLERAVRTFDGRHGPGKAQLARTKKMPEGE
jgi:hypothetical protein